MHFASIKKRPPRPVFDPAQQRNALSTEPPLRGAQKNKFSKIVVACTVLPHCTCSAYRPKVCPCLENPELLHALHLVAEHCSGSKLVAHVLLGPCLTKEVIVDDVVHTLQYHVAFMAHFGCQ